MNNTIHLKGFLEDDSEGIRFKGEYSSIANKISAKVSSNENSKHQPDDDYHTSTSVYLPKVFLQIYMSDFELTLEQAHEKQILASLGELDIYSEWYGYSEYTIEGFDLVNFTVGGHDLEGVLKNYIGKFVHIVIELQP